MTLQVFNATFEELQNKKHNTVIGISVGVKPMSRDIALSYMELAEKISTGTIQILIADEIAKFNYLVFSHCNQRGALARALRDGDKFQSFFEKIIAEFPPEKQCRFNILRWKDIQNNRFYALLSQVIAEFESNPNFKEIILSFVDKYTEIRNKLLPEEKQILPQEKRLLLCQYLLYELPTLLDGITFDGILYDLLIYPTFKHSGMSNLAAEIQAGKNFVSLTKHLNLKNTILVEFLIEQMATGQCMSPEAS